MTGSGWYSSMYNEKERKKNEKKKEEKKKKEERGKVTVSWKASISLSDDRKMRQTCGKSVAWREAGRLPLKWAFSISISICI